MIPRPDVIIGNLTHVGMARTVNQDYYGYFEPESDADFERLGRLLVVCDGVGGHSGGEVASQLAVRSILAAYSQFPGDQIPEALNHAVLAANRAILEESRRRPDIRDMATTVVALVLRHGSAFVAHVGDSRCYLIRRNHLQQMTLDHSLVQQMVLEDLISEDEMETHPRKNVILRSLGLQPDIEVDIQEIAYAVDDVFVISSDGLTGPCKKPEVLEVVTKHFDRPMEAAIDLVARANKHGGHDNITVQIARILAMTVEEGQKRLERGGPEWQHLLDETHKTDPKHLPTEEEMRSNPAKPSPPAAAGPVNINIGPGITGTMSPDEVKKIREQALVDAGRPSGGGGPPGAPQAAAAARVRTGTAPSQASYPKKSAVERILYWTSRPAVWLAWPFVALARRLKRR